MQDASANERSRPRDSERERAGAPAVCGWKLRAALDGGPWCTSYRAEQGREVAVVRVLRAPFAGVHDERTRWLRASWAANRFCHPRVLPILQDGVDERGAPVVVRAWAEGEPLAALVGRRALDAGAALGVIERVLDALEMAHAHGVVHGAVTPSNIIVTPGGGVRLCDFATPPGAVARLGLSGGELDRARPAAFVAPERRGDAPGPADEQTDIWAVGACLRFALTGEPPDPLGAGPVDDVRLPPHVAATLRIALARDPAQRYDTAYAMLGDVRRLVAGRRPKLRTAGGPVPSSLVAALSERAPSSVPVEVLGDLAARESPRAEAAAEWKGNLLLMFAIAVLVGFATFVLVRERRADRAGAVDVVVEPAP